jgi:ribosome-associated translation inhibitor RaiA
MHRILVIADHHSINPQARTYAEYRVFAAVARHIRRVRRVRVALRSAEEKPPREDRAACAITVGLEPSGSLRVRAKGSHVYAAINSAVEQLVRAMERQAAQLESSPGDDRFRFAPGPRAQTG